MTDPQMAGRRLIGGEAQAQLRGLSQDAPTCANEGGNEGVIHSVSSAVTPTITEEPS